MMNGKELLLSAMRGEKTPRAAWVPFVGCHGGKLLGVSAREYLTSEELLVQGLSRARELYRPDGMPVMFDLQVEAEILGCALRWGDDVPPSVCSHPLAGHMTLDHLPAFDVGRGRFPVILKALDRLKSSFGDDTAWYGLICGPFTLAMHLLGNDLFLQMFDEPAWVKRVTEYAADIAMASSFAYLDHGADVIAVVDPMISQISASHFETFVAPAMNRVFDAIRERGGLSSIFVCGDVTRNLEAMSHTRADNISVDEQIDMDLLQKLAAAQGKSFGGNIKLTSVLLLGTEQDARREAVSIMDACGTEGFILAPGCDLPFDTPPANLQAVAEVVHEEYQREVTRAALHLPENAVGTDLELPNYEEQSAVVLDVITLDSTSCAPCQYMMEAVNRAAAATDVRTYINEHMIKVRAGLGMMQKLGVKNLPTICIDGEVAFASIIPDLRTLVAAIEQRAARKQKT